MESHQYKKIKFYKTSLDKAKLWNQRLGHINFTNLANILKEEAAELPPLLKVKEKIYGSCLEGKQTKENYQKINEIYINRPHELLYMDLIGPTQTKSLERKKNMWMIFDHCG